MKAKSLISKPQRKRKATTRSDDPPTGRSLYGVSNFLDDMKPRIAIAAKANNKTIAEWLEDTLEPVLRREEKKIGGRK